MARTKTVPINLKKLHECGKSASQLIHLAITCDDIALANYCMGEIIDKMNSPVRKPIRRGAGMYFVRLQIGHLNEGLDVIQAILNDSDLQSTINACSKAAKENLEELKVCLKGGAERKKYEKYCIQIRSNIAFHYSAKLIESALEDRVKRNAIHSRITWGDRIGLSRFEFADDIVDTIVCRQILKADGNDVQKYVDEIMQWSFKKAKSYIDFGSEFIHRYVSQNRLA